MAALNRNLLRLIIAIALLSLLFQVWQIWKFVNAGPRFTAQDGQALCERVRALEQESIGFRQAGKVSPPCQLWPVAP